MTEFKVGDNVRSLNPYDHAQTGVITSLDPNPKDPYPYFARIGGYIGCYREDELELASPPAPAATVTYGSGKGGQLGRIYDRLRKRSYRQHGSYMPVTHAAYVAGVKDALTAVAAEVGG